MCTMLLCRSLEFIHLSELKVYIKLKNLFFVQILLTYKTIRNTMT